MRLYSQFEDMKTQVKWPFKGSLIKLSKCPNHSKFNKKVKSTLNWELNILLEIYFQGLQFFLNKISK